MEFVLVKHLDEVLEHALVKDGDKNEDQKYRNKNECNEKASISG